MSAAHILIACGTRPFRPDYVPFDGKTVFDSDEIIDLPKLPRSLAVIGAGVIGVEYATIFSALDVAVTLIEPRPTFLDFIDKELIDEFMHELRDRNVAVRLGSAVNSIERSAGGSDPSPSSPTAAMSRPRCCCSPPAASAPPTGSISTPPGSRSTIAAASRSIR